VPKPDNLPLSCVFVTKSGNLNFLESSGPVQACNGTDLPFTTTTNNNNNNTWNVYCILMIVFVFVC